MNPVIQGSIRQPISVTVGVILALIAGILAFNSVPVQMTPTVDSVVISVTTHWENASPEEVETDIIEEQEAVLGDVSGLVSITSISQAGQGRLRLEFQTGTDIQQAMAEVDQKLSEVPGYPVEVSEPVVEDVDPESVDYIAWIGLASTDPTFDASTLYDFMERRLRPRLERIPGVSQVGMHGAREKEIHLRVDPVALAQRGITYGQLVEAIQTSNENFSGGKLASGKNDIRIRTVGRFPDIEAVQSMVIRRDASGPIYLRDVADVVETHKELTEWVRARGHRMPFFNFQLENGGNLLKTMAAIQAEVDKLNASGGLLDLHAKRLGLNGTLELVQTYDSSTYVHDAIALVQSNILVGGVLAVATLLLFLKSLRTIGIIAIAIPISVIASMVVVVAMGRSINIVSLAGMAFSVGMVVDNAIVVIENIFRHLEMGKPVPQAAYDGTAEVGGAVVASTMTTVVVFLPILLIQDSAGQLFRDISLAIMSSVTLSLVVALTVIPAAAAGWLKPKIQNTPVEQDADRRGMAALLHWAAGLPDAIGRMIHVLMGSWPRRVIVIVLFAVGTIFGIILLAPPLDYLPRGNRNVVFGVLIPPPGYNLDQMSEVGLRLEEKVRPSWETAGDRFKIEEVVRGSVWQPNDHRIEIPAMPGSPETVLPPPLDHYFLVAWDGMLFHVAISEDKRRVVDAVSMLNYAGNEPDLINFAFQFPLFRTGGTTGSAIKIDLMGDDLKLVSQGAAALFMELMGAFGPYSITPEPANFLLPAPVLKIVPKDERLKELGMSRRDVGMAVQANSDGLLLVREFNLGGELKDLKIISHDAVGDKPIESLLQVPVATPEGQVVDLAGLVDVNWIRSSSEIKHASRQRAVTLQLTPPTEMPLEQAIDTVNGMVAGLREKGALSPDVQVQLAGSAGKLADIKKALLGDGSFLGMLGSSLFLAFLVIYLVMVVLFQSWVYPLVIMLTVPLATFGGFLGLALVHKWSQIDRYMPVQNLDVLSILGFVILAGVVVNNAILIVHQALNFLKGEDGIVRTPREAIAESVVSRVRPIAMSTLTSVGGMLPLVLMPGSGSELYRGLGAVVVGGLMVSTLFTLVLVPIVLSVLFDFRERLAGSVSDTPAEVLVSNEGGQA